MKNRIEGEPTSRDSLLRDKLRLERKILGYYDAFPPKAMNVAVDTVDVPDGSGNLMRKKVLDRDQRFRCRRSYLQGIYHIIHNHPFFL